jgi:hypothetical protein
MWPQFYLPADNKEGKDGSVTLNESVHIKGMYDEVIHHVKLSRNLLATWGPNELWRVRASVTTVTFELAIDGLGDKRLGGVNVQ